MNYIILDLEWDSVYSVRHARFINQILQIGAVKLGEDFAVADRFEVTVKSSVSKRVTGRFAALTGITTEKMRSGIPFDLAVKAYNEWCGDNTVTMTWSDSDLYAIMENEECLLDGNLRFKIGKYLDLQRFFQGEMRIKGHNITNQISLAHAAEMAGISTENYDLHTAGDDSLVCACLLKKCYNRERFEALIRDTSDPEFYARLRFKPYAISDIRDALIDRKQLEFRCDKCGGKSKRITPFKYRNRWFSADFLCKECANKFNGRVSFKKTYDDVTVRRKICAVKPKKSGENNDMQIMPKTV